MNELLLALTKETYRTVPYYGLSLTANDGPINYPALSTDKNAVEDLRLRIERSALSPVHFEDVIRDFLYEQYDDLLRENLLK